MRVLGIDPGYRRFGFSLAEWNPGQIRFHYLDLAVIATEPDGSVKRKLDDMSRRVQSIARVVIDAIVAQQPAAICIEAIALPYGKIQLSVVSGLGRVRGIIDAYAEEHGLVVLEVGAMAIKRSATGKNNATKLEVQTALQSRYPELELKWPFLKDDHEHAADAAGVIHACREHQEILSILKLEGSV